MAKDNANVKPTGDVDNKSSKSTVKIQFRKNRSFECRINRKMYCFEPNEEKEVPRSVIEHEDFKRLQKYFSVKG